jgi:hypothetical protein
MLVGAFNLGLRRALSFEEIGVCVCICLCLCVCVCVCDFLSLFVSET